MRLGGQAVAQLRDQATHMDFRAHLASHKSGPCCCHCRSDTGRFVDTGSCRKVAEGVSRVVRSVHAAYAVVWKAAMVACGADAAGVACMPCLSPFFVAATKAIASLEGSCTASRTPPHGKRQVLAMDGVAP